MRREGFEPNGAAFTSVAEIHEELLKMRGPDDKDCIFWAKNAAFDFPILEHLFRWAGLATPWYHRNKGCMYTMRIEAYRLAARPGAHALPPKRVNQWPHHAGFDVLYQIEELADYRRYIDRQLAPL